MAKLSIFSNAAASSVTQSGQSAAAKHTWSYAQQTTPFSFTRGVDKRMVVPFGLEGAYTVSQSQTSLIDRIVSPTQKVTKYSVTGTTIVSQTTAAVTNSFNVYARVEAPLVLDPTLDRMEPAFFIEGEDKFVLTGSDSELFNNVEDLVIRASEHALEGDEARLILTAEHADPIIDDANRVATEMVSPLQYDVILQVAKPSTDLGSVDVSTTESILGSGDVLKKVQ